MCPCSFKSFFVVIMHLRQEPQPFWGGGEEVMVTAYEAQGIVVYHIDSRRGLGDGRIDAC